MSETQQYDYAKLPDGSYAKFPKGTSPEVMRQKLTTAGLLKPPGPSAAGKEQAKKSPFSLTTGIEPTPGGVASWELGELGGGVADALAGIGKMVFQSPQSTTEKVSQGVGGPAGLLIKRLLEGIVEPLTHAGEVPGAIKDIASSGVGVPSLALQVPRTLSNLATMYETGRVMTPGVKSTVGGLADKGIQTPIRATMQKIAGAGKEPVLLEAMKREGVIKERAAAYEKAKVEIARQNQEKMGEHAAKMDEAKAAHEAAEKAAQVKYQKELAEYQQAGEAQKSAHLAKVAQARREWVDKAMESKRAQQTAEKVANRREALQNGQEAYSKRLLDNIQQTFKTVKSGLDKRWTSLRSTPINRGGTLSILKDEPLNSKAIAENIDTAEKEYLQGSPESIRQFRDLMNWISDDDYVGKEGGEGMTRKLRPITWDEARTHYSNLGDRMFSGDLPGNIVRAIRSVRDGLGKELQSGAERGGVGERYSGLLKDWSNFENDWKDTSSVTMGGGSPLARALKAPSAATLSPQVLGKTGDLLMERLGKYRDQGGSPATAQAIRKLNSEMRNLPSVRVPKMPGPIELPAAKEPGPAPEPPTAKEFKPPKAPRLKTADKPEPVPPIDPVAIRRKILTQYAGKPISWWDILPPRVFERPAMSFESIREWVAKQPRKELEPKP